MAWDSGKCQDLKRVLGKMYTYTQTKAPTPTIQDFITVGSKTQVHTCGIYTLTCMDTLKSDPGNRCLSGGTKNRQGDWTDRLFASLWALWDLWHTMSHIDSIIRRQKATGKGLKRKWFKMMLKYVYKYVCWYGENEQLHTWRRSFVWLSVTKDKIC